MRIAKWLTQGIGVGAGILAARIIHPPAPRPKKVPKWLFTEHDIQKGSPWIGENDSMRARSRVRKVVDSLESLGVTAWGPTTRFPERKRVRENN